jgi:hypothetical protein
MQTGNSEMHNKYFNSSEHRESSNESSAYPFSLNGFQTVSLEFPDSLPDPLWSEVGTSAPMKEFGTPRARSKPAKLSSCVPIPLNSTGANSPASKVASNSGELEHDMLPSTTSQMTRFALEVDSSVFGSTRARMRYDCGNILYSASKSAFSLWSRYQVFLYENEVCVTCLS